MNKTFFGQNIYRSLALYNIDLNVEYPWSLTAETLTFNLSTTGGIINTATAEMEYDDKTTNINNLFSNLSLIAGQTYILSVSLNEYNGAVSFIPADSTDIVVDMIITETVWHNPAGEDYQLCVNFNSGAADPLTSYAIVSTADSKETTEKQYDLGYNECETEESCFVSEYFASTLKHNSGEAHNNEITVTLDDLATNHSVNIYINNEDGLAYTFEAVDDSNLTYRLNWNNEVTTQLLQTPGSITLNIDILELYSINDE